MKKTSLAAVILAASVILLSGCSMGGGTQQKVKRDTIFIGIDESASFTSSPYYADSIKFISYYIYGHIHGLGDLKQPKAMFVSTIGGFSPSEPKSFRPLDDFQDESVGQIQADLRAWLKPHETLTDFNVFFEKVKELIQLRNLVLTPINIIIVSDGEPSKMTKNGNVVMASYKSIDLSALEYLARTITVRLLYASPVVEDKWQKLVPRKRVRMWGADSDVMQGWEKKLKDGAAPEDQAELWKWVQDNVDFRVRNRVF